MTKFYHGTDIESLLKIAKSKAILSPLYQKMEMLRDATRGKSEQEIRKRLHGKTIEQYALESVSEEYGSHEIESRVRAVSFAGSLKRALHYAERFEQHSGGAVLELELSEEDINSAFKEGKTPVLYTPRKQVLEDRLKAIYLLLCARASEPEIRQAFSKFKPEYGYL